MMLALLRMHPQSYGRYDAGLPRGRERLEDDLVEKARPDLGLPGPGVRSRG